MITGPTVSSMTFSYLRDRNNGMPRESPPISEDWVTPQSPKTTSCTHCMMWIWDAGKARTQRETGSV